MQVWAWHHFAKASLEQLAGMWHKVPKKFLFYGEVSPSPTFSYSYNLTFGLK